jgi:hypothetical protein
MILMDIHHGQHKSLFSLIGVEFGLEIVIATTIVMGHFISDHDVRKRVNLVQLVNIVTLVNYVKIVLLVHMLTKLAIETKPNDVNLVL